MKADDFWILFLKIGLDKKDFCLHKKLTSTFLHLVLYYYLYFQTKQVADEKEAINETKPEKDTVKENGTKDEKEATNNNEVKDEKEKTKQEDDEGSDEESSDEEELGKFEFDKYF